MSDDRKEKKPWTECPECGCVKGADHDKNCTRGKRKFTPMREKEQ